MSIAHFAAGLTLSTLLAGLSAETEAAFVVLRRQDRRRGRAGALRPHPVRSPVGRGRLLHPSRHLSSPAARARKSIRAAPMISTARCWASSRTAPSRAKACAARHRPTSASARGMLGKTSEVAAAAEQSAIAMREAAQTAAGLIRAIEDARSEVEVASDVATRAGGQAEEAVKVSPRRCRPMSRRSNRSSA